MKEHRNSNRIWFGKVRMKETTEKTWTYEGRIILKLILEKYDGVVLIELMWLRIGTS
jgi:hypothetical protein